MLEKFTQRSLPDRARIDVVRHRVRSRLHGHRRNLLAVGAALAFIGLGTIAANAAVSDPEPANLTGSAESTDEAALAERAEAADRADRSERSEPEPPQAVKPEESPESEPSDDEAESNPEAEESEESENSDESDRSNESEQADWVHPMPGAPTTSCFGERWGVMHAGVDLADPPGTPVQAVGAGTVTEAGWAFGGYGISVVVDHQNGVFTHYAHLSEVSVSPGDSVKPGQAVGLEGSTGDSTGPHLHFEVHQGLWNQVEPTAWMADRGVTIGGC